ncbi:MULTISPECIES: aldose epimerase family protein [unclassified Sphingomonas]|uniref:aldose epimerase family protein n=1 Tax=unclassified Sphingomonas TaxID=196159 RepID=UPI0006FFFBF3|nr:MULTISPECIES: aldose epimerase family protein [unclassified Sphingomonas]KQM58905.1 aldose epimerase [Sphingomonas sp. Leaf16]KQN11160.1 aldose epimerase [Sphingomonas sp. Leaf29]KQN18459.1 aldose epimerase [Sphingomonas sp. Leaf32]
MTRAERIPFGTLDGQPAQAIELTAGPLFARILPLGATLQSLCVPDREGVVADVVLGFDDVQSYRDRPSWFGVTVGRYANRIAGGRFSLDGNTYALETNNAPNHLHGGSDGFDQRLWDVAEVGQDADAAWVCLTLTSPDGDAGYPGTLHASATYTLTPDALTIAYAANTDAPTVVNLTNHAFFDLGGQGEAMRHLLTIEADAFLAVDASSIPTGERRAVAGTPFDFRQPHAIGARVRDGRDEQIAIGRGYDHNFIVRGEPGVLRLAAVLSDTASGRVMALSVTAPGLQLYAGNFLNGAQAGKGGRLYRQGDAVCLEPQAWPDTPNRSDFPTARLDPGQRWESTMCFTFSTR